MKQIRFIAEVITDYRGSEDPVSYARAEIDAINTALQSSGLSTQPQLGLVDKAKIIIEPVGGDEGPDSGPHTAVYRIGKKKAVKKPSNISTGIREIH